MLAVGQVTTKREVIQKWVEERGGWPAKVVSHSDGRVEEDVRFLFPGHAQNGPVTSLTWEEFFTWFDRSRRVFLFEEHGSDGQPSYAYGLI